MDEPSTDAASATARANRAGPRNTVSNAARHWSSVIWSLLPAGGPPTLMSAPSRRPKRATAAATSRSASSGSPRSPGITMTWPGAPACASASSLLGVAAAHQQPGPLGQQLLGGGAAQAARGARDDVGAVGQSQVHGAQSVIGPLPRRARLRRHSSSSSPDPSPARGTGSTGGPDLDRVRVGFRLGGPAAPQPEGEQQRQHREDPPLHGVGGVDALTAVELGRARAR